MPLLLPQAPRVKQMPNKIIVQSLAQAVIYFIHKIEAPLFSKRRAAIKRCQQRD